MDEPVKKIKTNQEEEVFLEANEHFLTQLNSNGRISDAIIGDYFSQINGQNNCHIFPSFVMTCLMNKKNDDRILNLCKNLNWDKTKTILFPTHLSDHWILVVVELSTTVPPSIQIWNSLGSVEENLIKTLQSSISHFLKLNKKNHSEPIATSVPTEKMIVQENSLNCGMFIILFGLKIISRYSVERILTTTTEEEANEWRKRLVLLYSKK